MRPSFAQQLVAESCRYGSSPQVKMTLSEEEKGARIMTWMETQPEPVSRIQISDAMGYGYSKTVVFKVMNKLEHDGMIEKSGNHRHLRYSLK